MCYNFFVGDIMKNKKIVFFDIDHTIYDPNKKIIPQSTLRAFEILSKRSDVILAIATGRAAYMLNIIETLKPYIDTYITINGQIVIHKGVIIHREPLSKETICEVKQVFNRYNLIYGCIGEKMQAINQINKKVITMFEEASMPLPKQDADFDETTTIYQMWAFCDEQTFEAVQNDLNPYQLVPWLTDGFDVVLRNRSKKDGIKKVLDYLDIPLDNAYAFGDGENDIEMLQYIPHSFAMGNAKEAIKKHATYTTNHYDEDGIYNALKSVGLIQE